ncbi:TolC family protein [Nitratifractor sp.]
MIRIVLIAAIGFSSLFAGLKHLSLAQAMRILDRKNIEIDVARYQEMMKKLAIAEVEGKNYGSLTVTLMALRSNDAGNVFGFKLQSREADFADFGFSEFLGPMGGVLEAMNAHPGGLPGGFTQGMGSILQIQPHDLNYPAPRNHFLTKFTYQVPLFTGWKLTEYKKITEKMYEMSKLDTRKLRDEKIFQLKKAFYDISLVDNYIYNLSKMRRNMRRLKATILAMKKEGYTKKTDVLEIDAKLAEVDSMLNQARLNRELAYEFLSFLLDTDVDSIRHVPLLTRMPRVSKADIERLSLDIQKAKLGLQVAGHAVGVAKSNFYPMIGAFGEYGSADDKLWNDFAKKDSFTIGVQVKWNVFNGGSDRAKLEEARLRQLKVARQVELAKKGIALKVKQLQTEIRSLAYDMRSQKKQLDLARAIYRTYEARYKEGLASITDVLIKQSQELQSLLKYLQVATKHSEKILELEQILDLGGHL